MGFGGYCDFHRIFMSIWIGVCFFNTCSIRAGLLARWASDQGRRIIGLIPWAGGAVAGGAVAGLARFL